MKALRIGELRAAAQSLIAVADNLAALFGGDTKPDVAPGELHKNVFSVVE